MHLKTLVFSMSLSLFLYGCYDNHVYENEKIVEVNNISSISESTKKQLLLKRII